MNKDAVQFYFSLASKRFSRKLSDLGLYPPLGIVLLGLSFIALSIELFIKTTYAPWIYVVLCIIYLLHLSEQLRVDKLKQIFTDKVFVQLRLIENGLAILPFFFFLIYKNAYLPAVTLIPVFVLLAFFHKKIYSSFPLPTPFWKRPFEFIIGYRKYLWLFVIAYALIAKAIHVDNYNLAVVAFASIFLIAMTFYGKMENSFYVWTYGMNAAQFLFKKIYHAFYCINFLALPGLLVLCILYPDKIFITVGVLLIGTLYLVAMLFAKYSAYPKEMHLPQALLLGLGVWFPPALLIVIPLFYRQALRRLNTVLL